ncbi:hypothetical protein DFJ74DRAFT_668902 [Hyaloraphidium curvatum]|nr:hypothetical protein DFJ74DRAFT_668902 [Hyaloraphidium curvatum]
MSNQDYKEGDKVEYVAVGGAEGSKSTGTITQVTTKGDDDSELRFTIKNDNTGKETTYKGSSIQRKVED